MALTTAAGWRRTLRYSLAPAAVCALVGALDRLLAPYRLRRRP